PTNKKTQVIIFQQTNDGIQAWHSCDAARNGYRYGCWHLALASILYHLGEDLHEIELVGQPNQFWVQEDITDRYISRNGVFSKLTRSPHGLGRYPSRTEAPMQSPDKHRLLCQHRMRRDRLKRLVAFRERQMQRLTAAQQRRVPLNSNYLP